MSFLILNRIPEFENFLISSCFGKFSVKMFSTISFSFSLFFLFNQIQKMWLKNARTFTYLKIYCSKRQLPWIHSPYLEYIALQHLLLSTAALKSSLLSIFSCAVAVACMSWVIFNCWSFMNHSDLREQPEFTPNTFSEWDGWGHIMIFLFD